MKKLLLAFAFLFATVSLYAQKSSDKYFVHTDAPVTQREGVPFEIVFRSNFRIDSVQMSLPDNIKVINRRRQNGMGILYLEEGSKQYDDIVIYTLCAYAPGNYFITDINCFSGNKFSVKSKQLSFKVYPIYTEHRTQKIHEFGILNSEPKNTCYFGDVVCITLKLPVIPDKIPELDFGKLGVPYATYTSSTSKDGFSRVTYDYMFKVVSSRKKIIIPQNTILISGDKYIIEPVDIQVIVK